MDGALAQRTGLLELAEPQACAGERSVVSGKAGDEAPRRRKLDQLFAFAKQIVRLSFITQLGQDPGRRSDSARQHVTEISAFGDRGATLDRGTGLTPVAFEDV